MSIKHFVSMYRHEIDDIMARIMHEMKNPYPNDKTRIEWCKWHPRLKKLMKENGYATDSE